ncbi:MAG: hypothetical protein ABL917_01165 [Parcubacteria group bacterium]
MTSDDNFGREIGLIHKVVVTGRKVGADTAFWTALADNVSLLGTISVLVKHLLVLKRKGTSPLSQPTISPILSSILLSLTDDYCLCFEHRCKKAKKDWGEFEKEFQLKHPEWSERGRTGSRNGARILCTINDELSNSEIFPEEFVGESFVHFLHSGSTSPTILTNEVCVSPTRFKTSLLEVCERRSVIALLDQMGFTM